MDNLSKKLKEIEVQLHNYMLKQSNLNKNQDTFNVSMASNMIALGQKVFPEQFKGALEKPEGKIIIG